MHRIWSIFLSSSVILFHSLFFIKELLCLNCITYDVTSSMYVIMGPKMNYSRCYSDSESICSNFTIKIDNSFEVSTQLIASAKSTFYSVSDSLHDHYPLYHPCETFFELERLIGKSSSDHEVEDWVYLDAYDTEWVSNTSWSELEHWLYFWIVHKSKNWCCHCRFKLP